MDAPRTTPTTTLQVELPGIGEPESLILRTSELGEPGVGQAVVRMTVTGVSFAEQQMRRGKYYDQPAFPFVPGYDVVGVVERLGAPAPGATQELHVGQRVAAVTKTGGWAERLLLDGEDLVPVPDGLDDIAAETLMLNGLTAWRMLHDSTRAQAGDTIVVFGAGGGVGSVLVQLAHHAQIRVIGVVGPAQLAAVEATGAVAVDYRSEDVSSRVAELAPGGVAAVFDHVGGPGLRASWRMLARGGTLVSYGSAATKDDPGNARLPVLALLARIVAWNLTPNGRRARFYNFWAGRRRPARFRAALRRDLQQLFALALDGHLDAPVAGRFALSDAPAALRFAERGGLTGKVVIVADDPSS